MKSSYTHFHLLSKSFVAHRIAVPQQTSCLLSIIVCTRNSRATMTFSISLLICLPLKCMWRVSLVRSSCVYYYLPSWAVRHCLLVPLLVAFASNIRIRIYIYIYIQIHSQETRRTIPNTLKDNTRNPRNHVVLVIRHPKRPN